MSWYIKLLKVISFTTVLWQNGYTLKSFKYYNSFHVESQYQNDGYAAK